MESGRVTRAIVCVGALACSALTYGATAARLTIIGATVDASGVTAYLDLRDENGQPLERLDKTTIAATIDGHELELARAATLRAAGEAIAYFFLVDVSKSLHPAEFADMKEALRSWIRDLPARDQIAIARFGTTYRLDLPATEDRERAVGIVDGLQSSDDRTALYAALDQILLLAARPDASLPTRRVVVVLSDGKDESSGLTIDDLRQRIETARVPIYAIGFSHFRGEERQRYFQALHRLTVLSGGLYREARTSSLEPEYSALSRAIEAVQVVRLTCRGCRRSTDAKPLRIALVNGSATLVESVGVNLRAPTLWRRLSQRAYVMLGSGAALLVVGVTLMIVQRRRRAIDAVQETTRPERLADNADKTTPTRPQDQTSIAAPAVPVTLSIVKGVEPGRIHRIGLRGRARIGRGRDCDVVLAGSDVSSRHFDLLLSSGHVVLQDLGSVNGTFVNGAHVVKQTRLESGDIIGVGRTEVRIGIDERP